MLTKIKLNQMEYCKIAMNGIEPAGLERIAELLESAGIPAGVMEQVEPVWATKRGTYPKRLAKALKKSGYVATPALMGAIGQVAADNSSRAEEFWFRIDPQFTTEQSGFPYDPGEHGDDSSCFHPGGQYEHAPYDIEGSGGMLLRTFEPSSPEHGYHFDCVPGDRGRWYAGVGRCFIVPTYVAGDGDYHDVAVMINGYCQHGYSHDLLHLARLVATIEGLAYRKVAVRDHWRRIYINNNSGYLIGPWEAIHDVKSVDIYITKSGRTPSRTMYPCNSCGLRCEEEDLTVIGDDLICPDCLEIDYARCERCEEWAIRRIAVDVAGEWWCKYCADIHSTTCAKCGFQYSRAYVYKVGQAYWCESCYDMYACPCRACGSYYAPEEICEVDGLTLCWNCAHNRCAQCGEKVNMPLKVNDLPYCRQCAPV